MPHGVAEGYYADEGLSADRPLWHRVQSAAGPGRRRLRKHWLLASFALHRWLDSPRMVKTADNRPRRRAEALC
jgi:hypothetical protein